MRATTLAFLLLASFLSFGADNPRLAVPKVYVAADLTEQNNDPEDAALVKRAAAALDLELINNIEQTRLYQIVGESDLEHSIKSITKGRIFDGNLADPKFAAEIRAAGLKYLLILSLEDADDENVQLSTKKGRTATLHTAAAAEKQVDVSVTKSKGHRNRRRVAAARAAAAATATRAKIGETVTEQQELYVSVRCKIFDASSGTLLDGASHEFKAARTAERLNNNQKGGIPDNFYRAAASETASWAVSRLLDTTFPAKIVALGTNTVTISRGQGAQIKAGQVFAVKGIGKEIKDPGTGAVLGREELTLGRVRITESDSKFAKARVIEDNGISTGALLRSERD
jgi:hypothetical protein